LPYFSHTGHLPPKVVRSGRLPSFRYLRMSCSALQRSPCLQGRGENSGVQANELQRRLASENVPNSLSLFWPPFCFFRFPSFPELGCASWGSGAVRPSAASSSMVSAVADLSVWPGAKTRYLGWLVNDGDALGKEIVVSYSGLIGATPLTLGLGVALTPFWEAGDGSSSLILFGAGSPLEPLAFPFEARLTSSCGRFTVSCESIMTVFD
jgi:hypothetical protein